jgi:hypothetical protein
MGATEVIHLTTMGTRASAVVECAVAATGGRAGEGNA